jgi:hypothetical protein
MTRLSHACRVRHKHGLPAGVAEATGAHVVLNQRPRTAIRGGEMNPLLLHCCGIRQTGRPQPQPLEIPCSSYVQNPRTTLLFTACIRVLRGERRISSVRILGRLERLLYGIQRGCKVWRGWIKQADGKPPAQSPENGLGKQIDVDKSRCSASGEPVGVFILPG